MNVHPSCCHRSPDSEAWKQALDYGVKRRAAPAHFVDAGVDSGAIIGQQTVPCWITIRRQPYARIHAAEHDLYPKCARGEIRRVGEILVQPARGFRMG